MNKTALISAVLALFLVASPVMGAVTQIDDGHSLTTEEKYTQFQEEGKATAEVSIPQAEITVSESCEFEECGVILPTDSSNDFIHLKYKEDIERDLRIYIPAKYIGVVTAERESLGGDYTADFSPTVHDGELYLVMETSFDGKGEATWDIGKGESLFNDQVLNKRDAIESVSGVSMSSDNWQYIEDNTIDDASYLIGSTEKSDSVIVEYKDTETVEEGGETVTETNWIRAPYEQSDSNPIYVQERGEEYYIITQDTDHPEIRYKNEPTSWDRVFGSLNEVKDFATDGIWEMF